MAVIQGPAILGSLVFSSEALAVRLEGQRYSKIMRVDATTNIRFGGCSGRRHHRVVLVALIQGIISTFHKNLGPLDQCSGEETGEGANDNFLEKRGVHRRFNSSDGARPA